MSLENLLGSERYEQMKPYISYNLNHVGAKVAGLATAVTAGYLCGKFQQDLDAFAAYTNTYLETGMTNKGLGIAFNTMITTAARGASSFAMFLLLQTRANMGHYEKEGHSFYQGAKKDLIRTIIVSAGTTVASLPINIGLDYGLKISDMQSGRASAIAYLATEPIRLVTQTILGAKFGLIRKKTD